MPETPEKATAATASPKSSPSKKEIDAATQALNHYAQGKRHLVVGDIQSAVNSLQEACKLLADQYGETAPECGDAYFCYGKALLEMARMESGVIGNALDGVPDGDDADNSQVENPEKLTDTEKVEVTDLVDQALEENFEGLAEKKKLNEKEAVKSSSLVNGHGAHTNGEVVDLEMKSKTAGQEDKTDESKQSEKSAASAEGEAEKQEGSTENEDDDSEADADSQEGESPEGESQDGETPEGETPEDDENKEEGEGDKTEDEEEEVTNLQLSWEMLELAKVIFKKQEGTHPKMKGKVAEVFLKLGEVGLESENYAQGIEDFKQCLEIQKNVLDGDDRCLAETHYQLGIAYSFCDNFDLAIEDFRSAVNVLETRISNLHRIKKEKADWTEEQRVQDATTRVDPFYTEQGEIDELNELLPEMKEKIVDMEQMKKDSKERIKAAKEAMLSNVMGGGGESSSQDSNPFGAPSTSKSSAPAVTIASSSSSSSGKEAKPIMVVRKKRKLEEGGGADDTKKIKGEKGESLAAVNGSKMANGQTEKMVTEGKEGPQSNSTTAEDLKEKSSEGRKKMELKSVS